MRDSQPVPSNDVEALTMDSAQNTISSVDAVRCFYLARVLQQKGEVEAARRWDEEGRKWIQKQTPDE